jgi:hypothetical protein
MDAAARRTLVRAAVLAWNRTIGPAGISRQELAGYISSPCAEARQAVLDLIEEMSRRKLQLFPGDQREIVDAELREQNNGSFYLAVTLVEDVDDDEQAEGDDDCAA